MSLPHGAIEIGDTRLEASWHGPGPDEAPTLVFLHEGLGCAALWRDFPERLAAATGCGALVYSRQGYGRSAPVALPRPLTYMQDEGRFVLPDVLAATGIRQAILIGHSDGGSIALVYAGSGRRVPRLLAVVVESAHVFCEDVSVESITQARERYLHGDLRQRLQRYHGDNVDGAFWGWNRAWLDPGFRDFDLRPFLPHISAPTLVIQGEADPYGTLRQVDAICAGIPGHTERLLLPGCGHAPHHERPDETLATMAAFIRRATGA